MKTRSKNVTGYRLTCTRRELDEYHMVARAEGLSLAEVIRNLLNEKKLKILPGNKESA